MKCDLQPIQKHWAHSEFGQPLTTRQDGMPNSQFHYNLNFQIPKMVLVQALKFRAIPRVFRGTQ